MKILDIIVEAAPSNMTPAEINAVIDAWKKQNPEAVAKYKVDPLAGKNPAAANLLRTAVGIAPLVQLNLNLYALEQVAAQPLATFQQSNPKFASFTQEQKDSYIKQMRDMYYGVWSAQFLIPILGAWLKKGTPVVNVLFDFLEGYIGRIPGKAGGLIRGAITAAGSLFVLWLASEQGIAWLADSIFMPIIRMTGSGVAFTWDKIWPWIQEKTGIPLDKVNPNTQTAVDNDRKATLGGMKLMDPYEFANKEQDLIKRMNDKNKQTGGGIVPGGN
jgi:hypothetical protein